MEITEMNLESPVGTLRLAASDAGLCAIRFPGEGRTPGRLGGARSAPDARRHAILDRTRRALDRYFAGAPEDFAEIPLDPGGTEFQIQVWNALRAIPRGQTRSYGDVAAAVGRPRAVRAVGSANRVNPIPIVVPCHRVIGGDGTLHGYAGKPERKEWLLAHEGAPAATGRRRPVKL
jgi:methylated-DNA-[protein]-cysteine S-methyltransferase